MAIQYPQGLPLGLKSGRSYQIVSPLQRSGLRSGRARQRRRFTSVPEMVSISWIFNDLQAQAFESWFMDVLSDGAQWFEMPLRTPQGLLPYTCRFADIYQGPVGAGPGLWSFSAQLEMFERAVAPGNFGLLPEYIIAADIFDTAMNRKWPA